MTLEPSDAPGGSRGQPDGGAPGASSFFRRGGVRPSPLDEPQAAVGELAAGDRVGPFTLLRFLARGGMGQVWEAWDDELRRSVALKLVAPERLDLTHTDRLAREARAGGRLSHPAIVTTLASGRDGNRGWIAQELIGDGWTLKDFLDEMRAADVVPPDYYRRVASLVAEIADGLQAAHDAGVIHRDVKPQNVLITADDRPKLTDFGLARVVDDSFLSVSGEMAGTFAYMSPEQVTAKRIGLDHRTDIFSLGVVLYEMLALRRPFDGDTTHQLALRILYTDPPDPSKLRSQCPGELAVICAKALEKVPDRRYATARDFAADLRRHLAHEAIHARPPGPLVRVGKWCRRRPAMAVGAAVGSVAVFLVSGLLVQNLRANRDLATSNLELLAQTDLAGRNAARAEAEAAEAARQAELARARTADVLALAAQRDLDALHEDAEALWPPVPALIPRYEEWLARARALREGRPADPERRMPERRSLESLRTTLAGLVAQAQPQSDPQVLDRARDHLLYQQLQSLKAERLWKARMLGIEPWNDREVVLAELRAVGLPEDPDDLRNRAWWSIDPRTTRFGGEVGSLILIEMAIEQAGSDTFAGLYDTLAWAKFRNGDPEGAIALAEWNLTQAGGKVFQRSVEILRERAAPWIGEAREARRAEVVQADGRIVSLGLVTGELMLPEPDDSWWHAQLSVLVAGIEDLEHPDLGLGGPGMHTTKGWGIERRLAMARDLETRLAPDSPESAAWADALAFLETAPVYRGVAWTRQPDLVPLGPDPDSGLLEFAHLPSGAPAQRGADGRLQIQAETGLVMVLLPGGRFWMGAQAEKPKGRHYDPAAADDEQPVRIAELSPFLLSKYEMTQGQWLRLTGKNPSYYQVSSSISGLTHPVERVSWNEAFDVFSRIGMWLPTEARWEYAIRGGTDTVFWSGDERESLIGCANLADQTAARDGSTFDAIYEWPEFDDGAGKHAAVGRYRANPFGLHDMEGNLHEWCLDGYLRGAYEGARLLDPFIPFEGYPNRILRGSCFQKGVELARSASRHNVTAEVKDVTIGVRPARNLE